MAEHSAGTIADVPEGEGVVVTVGGAEVALFNVDGTIRATSNACPHRGGPLGEGYLEDGKVACPWHGWEFDLTTGAAAHRPEIVVSCYPVRVEGDAIHVTLP